MARGLAEVRSEVSFIVRVANLSDTPVRLESGRKIGYAFKAPNLKVLEDHRMEDPTQERTSENTGTEPLFGSSAC